MSLYLKLLVPGHRLIGGLPDLSAGSKIACLCLFVVSEVLNSFFSGVISREDLGMFYSGRRAVQILNRHRGKRE
jgi:hypothetical protein